MKQVLQNLRTGQITVEEVPRPQSRKHHLLIKTQTSLISAGTERQLIEFGKGSILSKARSQPERVNQVLDKMKTDGIIPTLAAVFRKLDEPLPLGYCNAGIVLDVGESITEFKIGDRVISNGVHAEIVSVPKNLCAKIPDHVTDEQASFTVLSSISLQGIRLLQPSMGEKVAVFGLGLIGLISVQLLKLNGCEVLGIDIDPARLKLAESFGARIVSSASDPITAALAWTEDRGVDAVLVTASAKDDPIIHQAAQMSRKRGRIVLIGVVNLKLMRSDFYSKELTFQVSCSYGPGRYDDDYEQAGHDYPFGYVRWTEQRNFQAILHMMASKQIVVDRLITSRFPLSKAVEAYRTIMEDPAALGVIFEYPDLTEPSPTTVMEQSAVYAEDKPVLGVIGAGNFSKMTLLPALVSTSATISHIASLRGTSAHHLAKKFNITYSTSNYKEILENDTINAVIIAVRHNLHAQLAVQSLLSGKHVFVEKPLALHSEELERIITAVKEHPDRMFMVGFNRRFSPHTAKVRELLAGRNSPLCMHILVNAGHIPPESWIQNKEIGGGRIIGEACHFIDLLVCLCGSKVRTVSAIMVGGGARNPEDKMSIILGFEDGSVGSINYFSSGSQKYPKEKIQIFSDGRVLEIENFRFTRGYGFQGFKKYSSRRQDKGHEAAINAFVKGISVGGSQIIPFDELVNVSLATFSSIKSSIENKVIIIPQEYRDVLSQTLH
jgi:predicted dehydrogenase